MSEMSGGGRRTGGRKGLSEEAFYKLAVATIKRCLQELTNERGEVIVECRLCRNWTHLKTDDIARLYPEHMDRCGMSALEGASNFESDDASFGSGAAAAGNQMRSFSLEDDDLSFHMGYGGIGQGVQPSDALQPNRAQDRSLSLEDADQSFHMEHGRIGQGVQPSDALQPNPAQDNRNRMPSIDLEVPQVRQFRCRLCDTGVRCENPDLIAEAEWEAAHTQQCYNLGQGRRFFREHFSYAT